MILNDSTTIFMYFQWQNMGVQRCSLMLSNVERPYIDFPSKFTDFPPKYWYVLVLYYWYVLIRSSQYRCMFLKLLIRIDTKYWYFPYWYANVAQHFLIRTCDWYVMIRIDTFFYRSAAGAKISINNINKYQKMFQWCHIDTYWYVLIRFAAPLQPNAKLPEMSINKYQ